MCPYASLNVVEQRLEVVPRPMVISIIRDVKRKQVVHRESGSDPTAVGSLYAESVGLSILHKK
ncbi:hypothetical protein D3C87_1900330 [compost metagenome]